MTQLRPQNVAAASVRTAEGVAVARKPAGGRRWLSGRLLALAALVWLGVAAWSVAASAEARAAALREGFQNSGPRSRMPRFPGEPQF
jgi:hypothetical protein